MAARPKFRSRPDLFIDGRWVAAGGSPLPPVLDSSTEQPVGEIRSATSRQVDDAVNAAYRAQRGWRALEPAQRAKHLRNLNRELTTRAESIATVIAAEVGTPIRLSRSIQAGLPLTVLDSYVALLDDFDFERRIGNSLVVMEPVGVVGAITPWNFPLHQVMAKLAAALAAGSTIVLKPSGLAPLSAFILADAIEAAELPPGVFNLIAGSGAVIGLEMVRHPLIDMISFTGSTAAGVAVGQLAATTMKRVALELGGKSANVVLADADLPRAVAFGVNNCFLNSGQTCNALTRMLVPEALLNDVVDLARQAATRLALGDPFDDRTRLGPLVSADQMHSVAGYIELGIKQGAQLVTGGPERPAEFQTGFYCQPTIFSHMTPDMSIANEEIFGPVLSILTYNDEDDALRIANGTDYGLAAAVWSADPGRAMTFARSIRAGLVDINGGRFNPLAPFGGRGRSGIGRELGVYGLEEYLEPKSLQLEA